MKQISGCIIIGGGMAGSSLAIALAKNGITVTLVDAGKPEDYLKNDFDGRVSALAYSSKKFYERIDIWGEMSAYAEAILDIRISDHNSHHFLHFDRKTSGDEPMGYIIENRYIREALYKEVTNQSSINFITGTKFTSFNQETNFVEINLTNNETIKAKLLVSAEGKDSKIRELAGIKTLSSKYDQSAIVCTVKHEKHHNGTAQERFLPVGPFAILPMKDSYHSSLVWTEKSELVAKFVNMSNEEFLDHIKERFTDYLGKLEVIGPRYSYPLGISYAKDMIAKRIALVGDSAHTIHPIAGQGLNLGLRDIEALLELIIEYRNLGLDIGSQVMLKRYNALRRTDTILMSAATDSLNRLFSNNIIPIKWTRRLGLAAVQKLPYLKEFFVGYAMGKR